MSGTSAQLQKTDRCIKLLEVRALLLLFTFLYPFGSVWAKLLPSSLLKLDDYFSHHILVIEKSLHKLHLYENNNSIPRLIQSIDIATGKKSGNKLFRGDYRTPEGIYQLTEFLTHRHLLEKYGREGKIYGVGAFVLNYPNPIDFYGGKTGYGIWIHSTNDETRIEKGLDSRGCIVTTNSELINLARYIELNKTSIVIVHNLEFLSEEAWKLEREHIFKTLNEWLNSWKNEDLATYLSYYDHRKFRDPIRGNFSRFKKYKTSVFSAPGRPHINIENVSVIKTQNYAVLSFKQFYKSNTIDDVGKKLLYIKQDEYYNWKIISEVWTKVGIDKKEHSKVAFGPSQRFFKTEDPSQILEVEIKYAKKGNAEMPP